MSHVGTLVSVVLCFSCKLRAWSGGNYKSDEFILYAGHHLSILRLSANMDAICWGKATIVRELSNEHDPYVLVILSKQ